MSIATTSLPLLINKASQLINDNADEITELDLAIGDGDHLINLQRGLTSLEQLSDELTQLDWSTAFMKIGMSLMSTMGGASGSLFGTLFISMSKASKGQELNLKTFSSAFNLGVESVKQRGKADIGEKTMLDTLVPAANSLIADANNNVSLTIALENVKNEAIAGMKSTEALVATKGRASFLGDRVIGHIDAGARTSQLIICAIADTLVITP